MKPPYGRSHFLPNKKSGKSIEVTDNLDIPEKVPENRREMSFDFR
jgi:hypothetical protein